MIDETQPNWVYDVLVRLGGRPPVTHEKYLAACGG